MQNHLEISSKYHFGIRKCAKLVQIVVRKVYVNLTESLRKSKICPGGPIRAHVWAHIWAHKGPYGPQTGPGPNPDRAPTQEVKNLFDSQDCVLTVKGFKSTCST